MVSGSGEGTRSNFRWPAPPRPPLPWCPPPPSQHFQQRNPMGGFSDTSEDSQTESCDLIGGRMRRNCCQQQAPSTVKMKMNQAVGARGYQSDGSPARMLPPIGVFWDIENCQIPRKKSAVAVAQTVRNRFFDGYREAEFVVVCDVRKENYQVIQELNDAQVNLIHVGATSKNAADEKLRHSMRRFADIHGFPAAIVLISGDINFAPDLCDLRHRKKIHIILLHNEKCSESLILCANEHFVFSSLLETLPLRTIKTGNENVEVMVHNIPSGCDRKKVRRKLKCLSENCGGRVGDVSDSTAIIRFPSIDFAKRAQKRLDGEIVFGNQISVGFPQRIATRKDSLPSENTSCSSNGRETDSNSLVITCDPPTTMATSNMSFPVPVMEPSCGGMPLAWPSSRNGYESQQPPKGFCQLNNQENYTMAQLEDTASLLWQFQQNSNLLQLPKERTILGARNEKNSLENAATQWNWAGRPSMYPSGNIGGFSSAGWGRCSDSLALPAPPNVYDKHQQLQSNGTSFTIPPYLPRDGPGLDSVSEPLTGAFGENSSINLSLGTVNSSADGTAPTILKPSRHSLDSFRYHPSGRHSAGGGALIGRKCRTPSPYMMASSIKQQQSAVRPRKPLQQPQQQGINYLDNEKYFNPISSSSSSNGSYTNPVELHLTNLDQGIKPTMMKKILMSIFGEFVMVLHVSVYMQPDGHFVATLKVPTLQDAQYAISRLHRKKIGVRRISISYVNTSHSHDLQHLRWQIVSLLQEVPGYMLPLFQFIELFESRYTGTISVSDLCKMRDVCTIMTENNCRMVILTAEHRNTPSPNLAPNQEVEVYCSAHYRGSESVGWAEQELPQLPNILEPLSKFSENTHRLLASHHNALPLSSFCDCYESECGSLNITEAGVPLEHLISCVPQIEIAVVSSGNKYIRPAPPSPSEPSNNPTSDISKSVSPSLHQQLMQFSRELVDLLKTQPRCQLLFNRFIPAYHHHFGKQCRVADYGFTKLIDLLDTLPNVVHVIGEGKKRVVTLSFNAQMRRFTSDMLRVLKSQPFKRLELTEFPRLFERALGRPFDPLDYGLCQVDDLITNLSESFLVVSRSPHDSSIVSISISLHVQTSEEIEHTKVFAKEVVELLSHASQCSILFNKFIPAYHHHYGHQCRVADFGFTKLIELFEAIPDVVKVDEDSDGERRVSLTPELKLEVLNEQVCKLASARYPPGLPLKSLPAAFLWQYGYTLRPEIYQAADMDQLMASITTVKIENVDSIPTLIPIDEAQVRQLSTQIRHVLMNSADGSAPLAQLQAMFPKCYRHHLSQERLANYMADLVEIEDCHGQKVVSLNQLNQFARKLYHLLLKEPTHRLPVKMLEAAFQKEYSIVLQPEIYGKQNLAALLTSVAHTVTLRGKGNRRIVALNRDLVHGQAMGFSQKNHSEELTSCDGVFNLGEFVNGSSMKRAESVWDDDFHLRGYNNQVPVVVLPKLLSPPANIMEKTALISPCKSLIGVSGSGLDDLVLEAKNCSSSKISPLKGVHPPHPSQLPLPQMYLVSPKAQDGNKLQRCLSVPRLNGEGAKKDDDWAALESSPRAVGTTPSSAGTTPPFPLLLLDSANRRKLRLAAQFQTPMDF